MQISIINGVYADETANLLAAYPVNMVPVIMKTSISDGYLRPVDGAVALGVGVGIPRGGINWNDVLYRVSGSKLVRIDAKGQGTVLDDVDMGSQVTMCYGFDRLAIASNGKLWYWNGVVLSQVVDPDLGTCLSVIWIDGYFVSTDGTYIIVSDLNNPASFNPLKYGSSEIDPDPIKLILKLRNEVVAVNRYTIEYFNNVGGTGFPFQRIEGAQVQKGAIGAHSACVFADTIAFLGSGKNETPAVYLGVNGVAQKISTSGIDAILNTYNSVQLALVILETHIHQSHPQLWIRLADRTLVYDLDTTQVLGVPVWFQLTSAQVGFLAYRLVDLVWCYDSWQVCDTQTNAFGVITPDASHQFGSVVRWEFSTALMYNESRGAIWRQLELVCLPGRVNASDDALISTSYSLDGETWSMVRPIHVGQRGERMRRLVWFQQGTMRNWRVQRFEGDSKSRLAILRLEATLEALTV